jgi:hypothetical protein
VIVVASAASAFGANTSGNVTTGPVVATRPIDTPNAVDVQVTFTNLSPSPTSSLSVTVAAESTIGTIDPTEATNVSAGWRQESSSGNNTSRFFNFVRDAGMQLAANGGQATLTFRFGTSDATSSGLLTVFPNARPQGESGANGGWGPGVV